MKSDAAIIESYTAQGKGIQLGKQPADDSAAEDRKPWWKDGWKWSVIGVCLFIAAGIGVGVAYIAEEHSGRPRVSAPTLKDDPRGASIITWRKDLQPDQNNRSLFISETADGGYIMSGSLFLPGKEGGDAWLVRLDYAGKTAWSQRYGGRKEDWAASAEETSDGGFIVAGGTESSGSGGSDAMLMKTDGRGGDVWRMTYGGEGNDSAVYAREEEDGGFFFCGSTNVSPDGGTAWLVKTDPEGNVLWEKAYGSAGAERALSGQKTSDGGYILAGFTSDADRDSRSAWLLKTDSLGVQQWRNDFSSDGDSEALCVQQTSDGGYILAGDIWYPGSENRDAWLVKTDPAGNTLWQHDFGGAEVVTATWVRETIDRGYILVGSSRDASVESAWLMKTDARGIRLWERDLGGNNGDKANCVQLTFDGGYIIAGINITDRGRSEHGWLIRTDAEGRYRH